MKRARLARSGREFDSLLDSLFYCPACTTWRTKTALSFSIRPLLPSNRRYASTLRSSTAVNATKNIPPRYQGLYKALGDVRKKASAQVNLSRLQLALQGLESETPTTRVAVVGLNVQDTARRLARLLLADALADEDRWEKELLHGDEDFRQGVVIRFGISSNPNLQRPRTSIPVLYIPSNILERNNIEILVSSISDLRRGDLLQGSHTVTADAFLSPSIGTPTAANGRQTTISQPVHSTVLVAKGLDELLSAAELLASTNFTAVEDRESVKLVVNLEDATANNLGQVLIVDIAKAEEGLAAIRRSVTEATTYEHKWNDSGLPSLSTWLTLASAASSEGAIPRSVQNLISALLTTAIRNLEIEAALEAQSNDAGRLGVAARTNLEAAIEAFSRNAHQELQAGLASAWTSRNWRKLAWYKLFWRVDDVGLIITDLVTNAWLPQTERAVYELCGRLSQAGIAPVIVSSSQLQEVRKHDVAQTTPVPQAHADLAPEAALRPNRATEFGTAELRMAPAHSPAPLSTFISTTRSKQLESAIAGLTSAAQQIVFKTLSLTGLTAGLSALTYISLTPGSLYEAGTIVALGTAYALRRMQSDWLKATKALEGGLYDEGRAVIRRIVGVMTQLVENASKVVVDEVEVQSRREAEDAVLRAKEELERLAK